MLYITFVCIPGYKYAWHVPELLIKFFIKALKQYASMNNALFHSILFTLFKNMELSCIRRILSLACRILGVVFTGDLLECLKQF